MSIKKPQNSFFSLGDGSTISFRNAAFKLSGMREKEKEICKFAKQVRVKMEALLR
jgi:hypothetical protein